MATMVVQFKYDSNTKTVTATATDRTSQVVLPGQVVAPSSQNGEWTIYMWVKNGTRYDELQVKAWNNFEADGYRWELPNGWTPTTGDNSTITITQTGTGTAVNVQGTFSALVQPSSSGPWSGDAYPLDPSILNDNP